MAAPTKTMIEGYACVLIFNLKADKRLNKILAYFIWWILDTVHFEVMFFQCSTASECDDDPQI